MLELTALYKTVSVDSFKHYSHKTVNFSGRHNYYKIGEAYSNLGLAFFYSSQLDSSEYYLKRVLKLEKKDNPIVKANAYNNLAMVYYKRLEREKSIENNLQAIELLKGNDKELCLSYYNLACTYMDAGLNEKGLEYLKKSYVSGKNASRDDVLMAATINLASIYLDKQELSTVKAYLSESDALYLKNKTPSNGYLTRIIWGNYYQMVQDFEAAKKSYITANSIAHNMNNHYFILESTGILARNEVKLGNKKVARAFFKTFDSLYLISPEPVLGLDNLKSWATLEASSNDFEKSYSLLNRWGVVKDSLFLKEKRSILIDSEKKYETEKKERAIAEQQVQIQEQELSLAKKQQQIAWWSALGGLLAIGLGISFWINKERQKRKEEQIENLERQQEIVRLEALVSGEEKERVRLAQDLHDGINGDLAVIKYKFDALYSNKFTREESEMHTQAIGMLDNAIDQVRRISHNLAPPSLHNFSLLEAIRQYCTKIQSAHPLVIDYQTFGKLPAFDNEKETAIYRIIQELLNNIVKHAEATEVLIQLNHTSEMLEITVEDDGKGFDTENAKKGIGLQNIASRVSFLKGKLDIDSNKKGTAFSIQIPNITIHTP